jgi:hypothetical protein
MQPPLIPDTLGYRGWAVIRNMGDAIMPYIMELMSDRLPVHVSPDENHVLGVGSIVSLANAHSFVWGSGILNPQVCLPDIRREQIFALRGGRTADLLSGRGIRISDVPFGDPGIFADEILRRSGGIFGRRLYRAAIVPHHESAAHPFYQALRHNPDFVVVNVCDNTMLPLQHIADSETVISESLHGLIFAESLGKPAVWISAREGDMWAFKFRDWFSTVENEPDKPCSLASDVEHLVRLATRQNSRINRNDLRKAFPSEKIRGLPRGTMIEFRECRRRCPLIMSWDTEIGRLNGDIGRLGAILPQFWLDLWFASARAVKDWAERPYVLAFATKGAGAPRGDELAAIVAFMDLSHRTDCAILTSCAEMHGRGLVGSRLGAAVERFDALPARVYGILIRPMYERRPENFAVIGINA